MATEIERDVTVEKMKTRIEEGGTQHETTLSIVWDDDKALRTFAVRAIRVAAQSILRATGDIPAEFEVRVSELAKRERGGFAMKATPENAKRMMSKLSDAEYEQTLHDIGMNAGDIKRAMSKRAASNKAKPTK